MFVVELLLDDRIISLFSILLNSFFATVKRSGVSLRGLHTTGDPDVISI